MSNRARLRFVVIGLLFLCLCLSCAARSSSTPPPVRPVIAERNYKVSVKTGGREVDNFTRTLVHRVTLSRKQIDSMTGPDSHSVQLPFATRSEKDSKGEPTGVRVIDRGDNNFGVMGLRDGDLVTAIGRKRAGSSKDFRILFDSLLSSKTGSLTLERSGSAHKILYYLARSDLR